MYLINAIQEALVRPDLLFKGQNCRHCLTRPGLPSVRLELLIKLRRGAVEGRGRDQNLPSACVSWFACVQANRPMGH